MRILLINTTEKIGGPAVAASRLMEALKNNGIKAKLLVRDKQTDQISVVSLSRNWRMVWKFVWERIVIWKANHFKRDNIFAVDIANTGTDITSLPEFQQADVIHLHWINQLLTESLSPVTTVRQLITAKDSTAPHLGTQEHLCQGQGLCAGRRDSRPDCDAGPRRHSFGDR